MTDLHPAEVTVTSLSTANEYKSTAPSWLFGFIGAFFQVRNAKARGLTDTRRYWKAATISTVGGFIISIVLTVVMIFVFVSAFSSVNGSVDGSTSTTGNRGTNTETQSGVEIVVSNAKQLDPSAIMGIAVTNSAKLIAPDPSDYSAVGPTETSKINLASSILYGYNSVRKNAFCDSGHLAQPDFLAYAYDSPNNVAYQAEHKVIEQSVAGHGTLCGETFGYKITSVPYLTDNVIVITYDGTRNGQSEGTRIASFIKRSDGIWYNHSVNQAS